jgi:hypothetical protein
MYPVKNPRPAALQFLLALWMMLIGNFSYAQMATGDQEIAVSYGKYSFTEFTYALLGTAGDNITTKISASPIYSLSYRFYVNDHLALGITGSTQSAKFSFSHDDGMTTYSLSSLSIYNIVFGVKAFANPSRIRGKLVRFYLVGDFGLKHMVENVNYVDNLQPNTTKSTVWINSQFSPVCLSIGNHLCANLELGLGYKGLINGGLSYTLAPKRHAKEKQTMGVGKQD